MPWTQPKTWSTGEVLTASDMNAQLSGNLNHLNDMLNSYALLCDEKNSGAHGGTFTGGGWVTRELNTLRYDAGGCVSLSSSRFTLQAGTYLIKAAAPAHAVDSHVARLRNVTANSIVANGQVARCSAADSVISLSHVSALVTLSTATQFEIQHYCATTKTTSGLGSALGAGPEVYTVVEIWRVA